MNTPVLPSVFTLVLILLPATAGAAENRQALEEPMRRQLFDEGWEFRLGDVSSANAAEVDNGGWRVVDLPHDWSIEGQLDPGNPTGNDGGYFPAGVGWYRKGFVVPANWPGKRVSLYFEGIYMNAEVFVNGRSLGVHPYGYTSFFHDLTAHLTYGEENRVAVRVDNSRQKNCRWYSGSGIYRHVWLVITGPVHVGHWGVAIRTPDVDEAQATVEVRTRVKNETDSPQEIVVSTRLVDPDGLPVGESEQSVVLPAKGEPEVVQTLGVDHPKRWSPTAPQRYRADIRLIRAGQTLDRVEQPFGIRSIAFSAGKGFELNGQTTILNGGCVHHDLGCLGAAAYDRAEERKVELLKAAGFNAVRTAHNPPSEAFLEACDRLGLLVIDEAFDGWRERKTPHDYARHIDEWWQRDLASMVLRDRNHPCVILWSTGNEIIERKKPEAIETARQMADWVRTLDPTRPVTSAMTTWDQDWEIFDPLFAVHDVGGYNYQLHRAPADHQRVPGRVVVQTESYPRDAFANWELVQRHPFIIGDFVWTAMDYLGESGIGRYYYPGELAGEHWERDFYPWHGAYCGDIDLTGWRKPISHYRSLLYNATERLYLAVREPNPEGGEIKETLWAVWPTWESWTWPGYEGKDLQVEVYSRYPAVRLYLNDNLIGEQPTTRAQAFKAAFRVPYAAGTLKAAGVEGDREVELTRLETAGEAAMIRLTADRTTVLANGQDVSFVTVEVTDGEGRIQPNADPRLTFDLEGPGVIAGVDNANLKDPDLYVAATRKAWHGRALVVVRSGREPGEITLWARAPGLVAARLRLAAVAAD